MDGFGPMNSEIDSPGGTDLSFSLTLASLVTDFTANGNGAEFVAHIRYDVPPGTTGSCSGFVSDGTATSPTPIAGTLCTPANAPEPGTLGLIALAMLGPALALRRRRA
jgi:hypothetical protein